jgi:hypothetical protein
VESEVFADSFNLRTLGFVKIDNSPSLVSSSVVTMNLNSLTFFILSTRYIKDLAAGPVNELIVLIFENLEPS